MLELKKDYTIAIVTHNMQQAKRVADTTAFFSVDISQGGRTGYLVEFGPTRADLRGVRASSSPRNTSPASSARPMGSSAMRGRDRAFSAAALAGLALLFVAHGHDRARAASPATQVVVRGAGATFPAPLYAKWIDTFGQTTPSDCHHL